MYSWQMCSWNFVDDYHMVTIKIKYKQRLGRKHLTKWDHKMFSIVAFRHGTIFLFKVHHVVYQFVQLTCLSMKTNALGFFTSLIKIQNVHLHLTLGIVVNNVQHFYLKYIMVLLAYKHISPLVDIFVYKSKYVRNSQHLWFNFIYSYL